MRVAVFTLCKQSFGVRLDPVPDLGHHSLHNRSPPERPPFLHQAIPFTGRLVCLPWLQKHGSTIVWSGCKLTVTSVLCQCHYLQLKALLRDCAPSWPIAATTLVEIGTGRWRGYQLNVKTCRRLSINSMPHSSLLTGPMTAASIFCLYPCPPEDGMQTNIQEELGKDFIQLCMSPALIGFVVRLF